MVSKIMDIFQPLDAVQEDEDNLFEHLEEPQGSSDSDEDETVFSNPIHEKNFRPTETTATLPAACRTIPSDSFPQHKKSMTASSIHLDTTKKTQRVRWPKKLPVSRTVSESDIGSQNVTLVQMKKYSFEGAQQSYTNTDVERIVDISTPQSTSSSLSTSEIRPRPMRQRRRAVKRKSVFDLNIPDQFPVSIYNLWMMQPITVPNKVVNHMIVS